MSKETPSAGPVLTRRGLLFPLTVGFGAATLGLGLWGLARGMGSKTLPRHAASVDLSSIPQGTQFTVKLQSYPVFIRHRTREEIATAEADDRADLFDHLARNPNLDPSTKATGLNRRATADGRFIAIDGRCTRFDCVVLMGWVISAVGSAPAVERITTLRGASAKGLPRAI